MIKNKKHMICGIVLAFSTLLISSFVCAMDEPTGQDEPIYVATSDGQIKRVERWKIDQMKTLLVLLEHQRNTNSQANPLQASMLTIQELDLLNNAWNAIAKGTFDAFYTNMFDTDAALLQKGQTVLSLDQGSLRMLIKAAEKAEAKAVSAFCLGHVVPSDVQKNALIPYLIEPIIDSTFLKLLNYCDGPSDLVSGVVFSPDGRSVLVCGIDQYPENNMFMWDVAKNEFSSFKNSGCSTRAIWSPDGKYIVISGSDNQNNLCVYDTKTQQSRILIGHPSIFGLAFSPNGKQFVTGSSIENQDNVIIWDVITGAKKIFMRSSGVVNAVAWSPDGNYIAAGTGNNENCVIVWDAQTGKQHISIKHTSEVRAVAFSPDSRYIVASARKGKGDWDLIVSNATTGTQRILMQNQGAVNAVAWSPDGRYIVSSNGNDLVVWNAITGEQLKIGKGHPLAISSISLSTDNKYIVSGCLGGENNLILWSLLSIKEKEALRNCTFAQAQLLYQLVLASTRGFQVQLESPDVIQILNSLSDVIKNILQERFDIVLSSKCLPGKQGGCIIF